MKIFKWYITFSKLLVFMIVLAFFGILFFDGWVVVKLISLIENGIDLAYATVVGTVVSVMSTFSDGVILFSVKGYLHKAMQENVVGYSAKDETTAEERIAMAKSFSDCNDEEVDL